jgi:hypothetical protein
VKTISLAGNDLENLSAFRSFHTSAPCVANLALYNNRLHAFTELDHLRGYGLTLNELMLQNNPMMASVHEHVYHYEVARRFPKLKVLDQKPVRQPIEVSVRERNEHATPLT